MNDKTIKMGTMTFHFSIHEDAWQLKLAKSETRVKDLRQLALLNENTDYFVPAEASEEEDQFVFSFKVDSKLKKWGEVRRFDRKEKLRLLCNIARFRKLLTTRMTFFLHPEHLLFDDNLLPVMVYRGIRDLLPPYEINEETFLLQYKCLIIALFSKKFNFDELYSGSLANAADTEFERQVAGATDLDELLKWLEASYRKEQAETEKTMQFVPKRKFRLYQQLTFIMSGVIVLLAIPLIYFSAAKLPFQNHLLDAHRHFISEDYGSVISDLENENPEKLPDAGKYILAYSYIQTEQLNDDQKASIMKNLSLKSDNHYFLYWIYNGRGNLDQSLDLAKFMDDPVLIMYSYVKKIEKAKNDPKLSGTERETEIQDYQDKLKSYTDKYGIDSEIKTENAD
ncbi:type VII secretion protein EssB [Bacillus sp. BRMEA1]|uniref:type VII secretion protein EssB n=1 Tax=Neobacillus endophyticus TaxID=2738405 RepID=UPI0015676F95|nr:type VII secretion protein EssB [Neobacillus endophyticus]NRD77647.1 type VII secretion protein EssB [Neobacillus endophyticus]